MRNRTLILYLAGIGCVGFTVDGGIYAVIFNLFLLRLGYGPDFIGLVSALGLLVFTLVSIPAGLLGARKGTRRMMRLGILIMMVAAGLGPLAEFVPDSARSGWLIAVFIGLNLGVATFFVNAPPYLMASIPADQRERFFSRQVALWSIAAFAGSLAGGLIPGLIAPYLGVGLDSPTPFRYPLFLASVALLPGLLAVSALRDVSGLPSPDRERVEDTGPTPRRLLVTLALVRMLQVGGIAASVPFFNVYMDSALHVPTAQIGLLTSLGRLLSAPTALLTPVLTARLGATRTVFWSSLVNAVANLPMAFLPHPLVGGLSFIGVTSISSIRYASFLTFSMSVVSARARSALSGISEMASGVCFTLISLGGGQIIARYGFPPLFIMGTMISLVGTGLFWVAFMVKRSAVSEPVTQT
ncbi:MAG: MFS transporter [Anaerolineae bacterium]|nr:MFS transporter [Anaerolineae bacterium]